MSVLYIFRLLLKSLWSSKEQKGYLTGASWSGCTFLSSRHLGIQSDGLVQTKVVDHFSPEKITATDETLRSGLQKQYKIQKVWVEDDRLSQAEYVSAAFLSWMTILIIFLN